MSPAARCSTNGHPSRPTPANSRRRAARRQFPRSTQPANGQACVFGAQPHPPWKVAPSTGSSEEDGLMDIHAVPILFAVTQSTCRYVGFRSHLEDLP